jgi:leader peptidase (prepilin peptidase)/N-methyltransferase
MPEIANSGAMHALFAMFAFLFGGVVGSFLNVCIHRWPLEQSVVKPRSRCPKCENHIAWYDNVPILSWLILRAKCRNCGEPISWQYPLVEAITATLFLGVYLKYGLVLATPVYMYICAGMVVVTFVDLATWTIPDEISLPGIFVGLACSVLVMFYPASGLAMPGLYEDVFDSLLGILVGGGIIYALDRAALLILKKPGMGMGDVKLLAMLGAFFGWKGVFMIIMMGSMLGSVIGIALILVAKRRGTEEEEAHYIPFGPFLALGGLAVLYFGNELHTAWYMIPHWLQPATM